MAAAVQVAYLPAAPEQPGGTLRGTRGRGLQGSGTLEARPARLHRATNRSLRPREVRGGVDEREGWGKRDGKRGREGEREIKPVRMCIFYVRV